MYMMNIGIIGKNGMAIRIESNVPLPGTRMGRLPKYPFKIMRVRDSFAIDREKDVPKVRQAACHFASNHGGRRKYSVLKTSRGYRCWRVK